MERTGNWMRMKYGTVERDFEYHLAVLFIHLLATMGES